MFLVIWQTDIVTSVKSLLKLAEASQLSSHLDGTLSHGNVDWKELHQVRPSHYDINCFHLSMPVCLFTAYPHLLFCRNSSHLSTICMWPPACSWEPSASSRSPGGQILYRYSNTRLWLIFHFVIWTLEIEVTFSSVTTSLFGFYVTGCAAVHDRPEDSDEGCSGGQPIGQPAERGWSYPG